MSISIASEVYFEDGASEGRVNIYNSRANHYIQRVTITLEETGETVYSSGGIEPGQYIEYITLTEKLRAGDYRAIADFTAYTVEDHRAVGSAAAEITLHVGS